MTTTIGPENPAFVGFVAPSERPNPTGTIIDLRLVFSKENKNFVNKKPSIILFVPVRTPVCYLGELQRLLPERLRRLPHCDDVRGRRAAFLRLYCRMLLVPATAGSTTTAYFCGSEPKFGKTLYRADPAKTTSASAGSTGTILASRTSNSTVAATSTSSTYGPAPGTPPPSPPSKAWIAGAVIGILALFALMGVGTLFFLRRRRRRRMKRQEAVESDGSRWMGGGGGGVSSQEDLKFYYNQSMKLDPRASKGPWSPYSSGYGSLRRGNEEGRDDSEADQLLSQSEFRKRKPTHGRSFNRLQRLPRLPARPPRPAPRRRRCGVQQRRHDAPAFCRPAAAGRRRRLDVVDVAWREARVDVARGHGRAAAAAAGVVGGANLAEPLQTPGAGFRQRARRHDAGRHRRRRRGRHGRAAAVAAGADRTETARRECRRYAGAAKFSAAAAAAAAAVRGGTAAGWRQAGGV
ncbi:hypothetical protein PWT90_04429 [Aphanocladium album]|nr:hypothetical protein PWT90_04429 [Aphanocladium album]